MDVSLGKAFVLFIGDIRRRDDDEVMMRADGTEFQRWNQQGGIDASIIAFIKEVKPLLLHRVLIIFTVTIVSERYNHK